MWRIKYIALTAVSFVVGMAIVYSRDNFVRGFLGDVVVVIFLYGLIKSFVNADPLKAAIAVFVLAAIPEFLQYFHTADLLHLTGVARIVVGTLFDPLDFLAYTIGAAAAYLLDMYVLNSPTTAQAPPS